MMKQNKRCLTDCDALLTEVVIGAAIEVHRALGPGLLEAVYEEALFLELNQRGLGVARQVEIPVSYKGEELGVGFRADLIVNKSLLLELKSVSAITDIHLAQVITYLRFLGFKRGLLLNFNVPLLKQGIKRVAI